MTNSKKRALMQATLASAMVAATCAPASASIHIYTKNKVFTGVGNSDPTGDMDTITLGSAGYIVNQIAGYDFIWNTVKFETGSTGSSSGPIDGNFDNTGFINGLFFTYSIPYTITIGGLYDTLELKATSWDVGGYHWVTNPQLISAANISSATANIFVHITQDATAVPELASWAMMLAGFSAVGVAMRRRRQSVKFSITA